MVVKDDSDDDIELQNEEDVDRELVKRLRALLRDSGRFHTLCEDGYRQEGGKLESSINLRNALNLICRTVALEEVTMEEADELFIPHLDAFEYYQLAKPFFEALARSLDPEHAELLAGGGGQEDVPVPGL